MTDLAAQLDDSLNPFCQVAVIPTVEEFANLLRRRFAGVLATHGVRMAGYPFASRVPYCADAHGQPLLAVSALAQHTKNLRADGRVMILGGYVLSRSTGVNKIKGGSVQIN